MSFSFDMKAHESEINELKEFISSKQTIKGSLMPVLQYAQEKFGYLPVEVLKIIAKMLEVPLSEVYGVVTFYAQFTMIPKGKYNITVCEGTACYVKGARKLSEKLEELLNVSAGGTTSDRKFSLSPARCIGMCALAPVITVNDDVYGKISVDKLEDVLKKYE